MRVINIACLFLILSQKSIGQVACDGCIYDSIVIEDLKNIYLERSQKYYDCELDKKYQSFEIGTCTYFKTPPFKSDSLKIIFDKNLNKEWFSKTFQQGIVYEDVPVVRVPYIGYKEIEYYNYIAYNKRRNINFTCKVSESKTTFTDGYDYPNEYTREGIVLNNDFKTIPIPKKYADLINYVDCVIDTSSKIFLEQGDKESITRSSEEVDTIEKYVLKKLGGLNLHKVKYLDYSEVAKVKRKENNEQLDDLARRKKLWITSHGRVDKHFLMLYKEAKRSNPDKFQLSTLEYYVELIDGPKDALDLKRARIVRGKCSMDNSPVHHLKEIATLSAQANNWDVFMRTHMNIINDRFQANVYSSYGEASRDTPVRDFEAIGIEPSKLFCGSLLRTSNSRSNHYFSSSSRIARGISRLKYPSKSIELLENMVKDSELDLHNKMIAWYTLHNFYYYNNQENKQDEILELLNYISATVYHRYSDKEGKNKQLGW